MELVNCLNCKKPIPNYPSHNRKYCSIACRDYKTINFCSNTAYYLIGVYLGDGTLGIYKQGCYKQILSGRKLYTYPTSIFSFATIDYEFALKVKNCLMTCLGMDKLSIRIRKPSKTQYGKNNMFAIFVKNKQVGKFIKFVKRIEKRNFKNLKKQQRIEILRGFFDSEGCITLQLSKYVKKKNITTIQATMSNKDKKIIDIMVDMLNSLGIKNSVYYKKSNDYFIILIYKDYMKILYSLFGNKLTIKRKDERVKRYGNN